jgi:hypothetical protein
VYSSPVRVADVDPDDVLVVEAVSDRSVTVPWPDPLYPDDTVAVYVPR